ncbi:hypothetical protein Egran_07031 [Elaphomyces granulatus]|uniref:Uncharacterized protein n=1 Tax=Elaphomyces granulatus TaxID=519963 RepID=A0A232LM11_9EURO|nr:hypothetical protein Egran_07031 [Elaphomyces granulatus]
MGELPNTSDIMDEADGQDHERAEDDDYPRYIMKLFSIKKSKHPLMISEEESRMHAVPQQAKDYLRLLEEAGYDFGVEATCRLAADCLIVPAAAQARKNMGLLGTHKTTHLSLPTTPTCHPRGNDDDIRMPLEIYPECDLKTEVQDPLTKETVVVTGRADWAAGYDGRASAETLLLCGEAKQGKTFGEAESQLLVYLAICRHERQKHGKLVPSIQGFRTDSRLYEFQSLSSEGTLYTSYVFDVRDDRQLGIVYNFIIQQIQTAIELSPSTTPVKGSVDEKRKAVTVYAAESFWGVFDPPPAPSEDDELPDDPPF